MSFLGPYSTNQVITEFPMHAQAKKTKDSQTKQNPRFPQHHEAHWATELDVVWSLLVSSYWCLGGSWGHGVWPEGETLFWGPFDYIKGGTTDSILLDVVANM